MKHKLVAVAAIVASIVLYVLRKPTGLREGMGHDWRG